MREIDPCGYMVIVLFALFFLILPYPYIRACLVFRKRRREFKAWLLEESKKGEVTREIHKTWNDAWYTEHIRPSILARLIGVRTHI
jgi:hypothetical protein